MRTVWLGREGLSQWQAFLMACMLHGSLRHSRPSFGVLSVLLASVARRRSSGLLGVADYFLSQQNTQAAVHGRSNEHHWPCLTLVATAKKKKKKSRSNLSRVPQTAPGSEAPQPCSFSSIASPPHPLTAGPCTRWAGTGALRTSLSLQ